MYAENQHIKKRVLNFLKQQICKEKQISYVSGYVELTEVLQFLNNKFNFGTDMEFAKELFNVPLPDRYQWLEDKDYGDWYEAR